VRNAIFRLGHAQAVNHIFLSNDIFEPHFIAKIAEVYSKIS